MSSRIRTQAAVCLVIASAAGPAAAQSTDSAARSLAATCFTCHGTDGRGVGTVPGSIAGRDRSYMIQVMNDFKTGKRPATVMHQLAKGYTDAQIEQIAAYFASVSPTGK